jgi:hypothetical protein
MNNTDTRHNTKHADLLNECRTKLHRNSRFRAIANPNDQNSVLLLCRKDTTDGRYGNLLPFQIVPLIITLDHPVYHSTDAAKEAPPY